MKKYIFGVDLGGTTVKMGLFLSSGELLHTWEIPTRTEKGGKYILGDIADSVIETLREREISKDDVEGIGIGVPGPVLNASVVTRCVNLGWGEIDVAGTLSKITGLPVKVGNDANGAALGEMWQGGAKGSSNVVMVTLGTGVGGGIIVDGKIVAGANGAGGEIGHLNVCEDEHEACNCGQHGCLEQYASATGVVRMAKRKLAKISEETSLHKFEDLTAKDVFDEAKAGDKVALEIVDEVCEILGKALGKIACVVNPEVFLIGGGVSKAGQILIDTVKKYYVPNTFTSCKDARFELASLGNDAGMYGCMCLMLD